jgi:hypothetical protein
LAWFWEQDAPVQNKMHMALALTMTLAAAVTLMGKIQAEMEGRP